MVVFKTKVLHFKTENRLIRETNGRRKFLFSGQSREFFAIINCLLKISTLFLQGGSEHLACFEPTEAAMFLKKLEVRSVLYSRGKSGFKGKGFLFIRVSWTFSTF